MAVAQTRPMASFGVPVAAAYLALASALSAQDSTTWWRFNSAHLLQVREAVHHTWWLASPDNDGWHLHPRRKQDVVDVVPTSEQVQSEVVPALYDSLQSAVDAGLVSRSLMALAKIGVDGAGCRLVEAIAPHLAAGDAEIRRSAVLALGIAARYHAEALPPLLALVSDAARSQALRAFAAYALGVAATGADSLARRTILLALRQVLERPDGGSDLRVAAVLAIGQLTGDERALAVLARIDEQPGDPLVAAHCVTAISRALDRDHPDAAFWRERFADRLNPAKRFPNVLVRQSCALALGKLCRPVEDRDPNNSPDFLHGDRLVEVIDGDPDVTTRHFAVIALGESGGDRHRAVLLDRFQKSPPADKAWYAFALGVLSSSMYADQKREYGWLVEPDDLIGETLLDAFRSEKQPDVLAALAIGLALNKHLDAADAMRDRLLALDLAQEELASSLCLGLGLMFDTRSTQDLRIVTRASTGRPDLLHAAGTALGMLGNFTAPDNLLKLAQEPGVELAARGAAITAVGRIGNSMSIEPLLALLADDRQNESQRAFAAAALGELCARGAEPWNVALVTNVNFAAATPTLTDFLSGDLSWH